MSFFCAAPAHAHRTLLTVGAETGSGNLVQEFAFGQWGFAPESPFFVFGEVDHEAFYVPPDHNSYRFMGGAGYESVHFLGQLSGGYETGPYQGLSYLQFGGNFGYRLVPWKLLTPAEEASFKPEDRAAEIERRKREVNDRMLKAPMGGIGYDFFQVKSLMSARPDLTSMRFTGWLRATLEPYWFFVPSVSFYLHSISPIIDRAAYPSYSSPALRLIKFGPGGAYSGIYGLPDNTQQIYTELKIFPQLKLDFAITRASLITPPFDGYSFWIGFDRYLTRDRRWSISPSYEQYLLEKKTFSYFMVAFRFGEGSSYTPTFGTTP